MKILAVLVLLALMAFGTGEIYAESYDKDVIETSAGPLKMTFIGHGTLMFEVDGKVIHIDPWTKLADYKVMPKADLILITHEHRDHLDAAAVNEVRKENSLIIYTEACSTTLPGCRIVANNESEEYGNIHIEAVPAYNLVHKRETGEPFHPKGRGNGYLLTIGGKKVLVAGDTENIPELKALRDIDVAFLPMNLPYTMTPEMVADLARAIKPKVLYPYHFGDTDTAKLIELLKDLKETEIRIRKLS